MPSSVLDTLPRHFPFPHFARAAPTIAIAQRFSRCSSTARVKIFTSQAKEITVSKECPSSIDRCRYCENCSLGDTILLFREMQLSDVRPDDYTFPSILKSCANELALRSGQGIHCVIVKVGCEVCVFVGTGLIDFYGKCGEIESARHLFDRMPDRNVVSCTAIIVGYAV
ncbi:putative pentatricopeptide repeat-containing protein [Nymphaea thermarum]|nr:putative pentatricopeptide repeat-containing protein [Nymphaea thermarum]